MLYKITLNLVLIEEWIGQIFVHYVFMKEERKIRLVYKNYKN